MLISACFTKTKLMAQEKIVIGKVTDKTDGKNNLILMPVPSVS